MESHPKVKSIAEVEKVFFGFYLVIVCESSCKLLRIKGDLLEVWWRDSCLFPEAKSWMARKALLIHRSVLDDLISGDPNRLLSASHKVPRLRDLSELNILLENLDDIEARIKNIELGGAFRPNSVVLTEALAKLRQLQLGEVCFCTFYLRGQDFDPVIEEKEGFIKIEDEKLD